MDKTSTGSNDIDNEDDKKEDEILKSTVASSSENNIHIDESSLLDQGLLIENKKLKDEIESLQNQLLTIHRQNKRQPLDNEYLNIEERLENDNEEEPLSSLTSKFSKPWKNWKRKSSTDYLFELPHINETKDSTTSIHQRKNRIIIRLNDANNIHKPCEKKSINKNKHSDDEDDQSLHDHRKPNVHGEESINLLLSASTNPTEPLNPRSSPRKSAAENITNHHNDSQSLQHQEHFNHGSTFYEEAKDRGGWLVGLLILQSMSSFILQYNEKLLKNHIIIVNFLTMLVGAGGNAGNQASVRVIRGLAVGSLNNRNKKKFLFNELKMAFCLSMMLGIVGFIRALLFSTPVPETIAITSSLLIIVAISIGLGSLLPLGMQFCGIDPAHSSTTIQVIMDILGVTITCQICKLVLNQEWWHIKSH